MTYVTDQSYSSGGYYTCDNPTIPCNNLLTVTEDVLGYGWGRSFNETNTGWLHFCPKHLVYATSFLPRQDLINHPPHYNSHPSNVECIDIIKHMDYRLGSVIKYLWRAGLKDGNPTLQDLKKAQWYLNNKIEDLEKEQLDTDIRVKLNTELSKPL